MIAGNVTVSPDGLTITVFDTDGVTALATFSLDATQKIMTRLT
jgi:hypothetical protein